MASRRRALSIIEGANHVIDKGKERINLNLRRGKELILHGTLFIEIREAVDLPDMDHIFGIPGLKLNKDDVTDAYVEIRLGNAILARTNVIDNCLNPKWNESYRIDVCHTDKMLEFCVLDKDELGSEMIGEVAFKIEDLLDGEKREGWFDILKKRHVLKRGKLHLMVKFVSCDKIQRSLEVDCYFPVHHDCLVTLYQDAHADENMPCFKNMSQPYKAASCWSDVYQSLDNAQRVIMIAGWSVWHNLKLLRETGNDSLDETKNGTEKTSKNETLGEILVRKAKQGVFVYIMLWQEYAGGIVGESMGLSLGTHGSETQQFCQMQGLHNLQCVLVPRMLVRKRANALGSTDVIQNQIQNQFYTHHQKTIICDAACTDSTRLRIVAYLGGLDLTDGRWDTPDHELFSTLQNEHNGDFRNAMIHPKIPNLENQGPREPWHDIHCKLEGKIAQDVFYNFKERWERQGSNVQVLPLNLMDKTFDLDFNGTDDPMKKWSCQIFRSINEDSAIFDQSRAIRYDYENQTLINKLSRKSGSAFDQSILQAYVQHIRNAEHFIYIENQYFLGSSYCWELHGVEKQSPNKNCQHIIPAEIAQKIVQKIYQGSRFVAYILIPMFPEGDPTDNVTGTQEILHWQFRTMEMMYKKVCKAIKETGSDTVATDWLIFMCLGKKEVVGKRPDGLDEPSPANPFARQLHFPIYVHSKMMIVDDVYIIVGSANINQRSMAGTRDTEIAVGAWQPNFSFDNSIGDVHSFRLGLFCEHFNLFDDAFIKPWDIDCVRKIKNMLRKHWMIYNGQFKELAKYSPDDLKSYGNMLPYPIEVEKNGTLKTLDNIECFPSYPSTATIKGRPSTHLPLLLTS